MIVKAFSIYDEKAAAFMPPFFLQTRGMAVRAFSDLAKDKTHEVSKHAEDYSLYEVGEFDQRSGSLVGVIPSIIIRADQVQEGDILDALAAR